MQKGLNCKKLRTFEAQPNYHILIKKKCNASQYFSDNPVMKEVLGHRRADWSQQLKIVVKDIQEAETFKEQRGRKMPGALGFQRRVAVDYKVHCFFVFSTSFFN